MASQVSPNEFVNITRPQSRAPSMNGEAFAAASRSRLPVKKQAPQKSIDEFWDKFTTKHPGKIFTILPDNLYAKRAAAHAPKGSIPGKNALASYEEAVQACKAKVAKIVDDPDFDIEADFKRSQASQDIAPDCLTSLDKDVSEFQPMSVKRVEV